MSRARPTTLVAALAAASSASEALLAGQTVEARITSTTPLEVVLPASEVPVPAIAASGLSPALGPCLLYVGGRGRRIVTHLIPEEAP